MNNMIKLKKYTILRDSGSYQGLISLTDSTSTYTGYKHRGYTGPDFVNVDTKEEAEKYLSTHHGYKESIIELDYVRFTIKVHTGGRKPLVVYSDLTAEEYIIAWLLVKNQQYHEWEDAELDELTPCPKFCGMIETHITVI